MSSSAPLPSSAFSSVKISSTTAKPIPWHRRSIEDVIDRTVCWGRDSGCDSALRHDEEQGAGPALGGGEKYGELFSVFSGEEASYVRVGY